MSAAVLDNDTALVIDGVSKTFRGKRQTVKAIGKVSLHVRRGEFISIIGPSGCGKTTLLRVIAGLAPGYEGGVYHYGKRVEKPGLDRGMLFQEHRLLPWLTVTENVTLGIDGSAAHKEEMALRYLEKVRLQDFRHSYPNQLSGGMAQRAAIARALICQSKTLLLDEPFGALDALTRTQMQDEIARLWTLEKITMVLVTHDIEEAIYLSDRIVVLTHRPAEISDIITVG
ncbi:MAG: ABC transporter ATP-binding protein, partial [Synergistaceae bacterium]|nr:ABC transporter ATP-binding protein [Synergistaceae bacterium]